MAWILMARAELVRYDKVAPTFFLDTGDPPSAKKCAGCQWQPTPCKTTKASRYRRRLIDRPQGSNHSSYSTYLKPYLLLHLPISQASPPQLNTYPKPDTFDLRANTLYYLIYTKQCDRLVGLIE